MNVKMLIKSNEEPHSFELKSSDMAALNKADLIVYNGANMEGFIKDVEAAVKNKEKFLNLSQGLTLLEAASDLASANHDAVNPHTWLSVKNAMEQLEPTAAQLKKIADFVKEHGIKTILFEGKATPKVAETLAKNTGTKTGTIYTLENLTEEEAKLGYIELMRRNLRELEKVLSE